MKDEEIKLILTKLKIVSETEESGAYICDRGHSKLLLDYITNLQEKNKRLKRENYIMLSYLQLIVDIGYDYDGLNNIPTLKCLIDELVDYANMGTKLDDKTIISEGSNGEEYNILGEEILQGSGDKE